VAARRVRRRKQLLDDLQEKTEYCKLKKHQMALCGELTLERAMDLSQERLQNE